MDTLTIGKATKAFIAEHVEWHRTNATLNGRAFYEADKLADLYTIAHAIADCNLDKVKAIAAALLPVTSAIASAMVTDNEGK